MTEGVFGLDMLGRITYANAAACRLTGWTDTRGVLVTGTGLW